MTGTQELYDKRPVMRPFTAPQTVRRAPASTTLYKMQQTAMQDLELDLQQLGLVRGSSANTKSTRGDKQSTRKKRQRPKTASFPGPYAQLQSQSRTAAGLGSDAPEAKAKIPPFVQLDTLSCGNVFVSLRTFKNQLQRVTLFL